MPLITLPEPKYPLTDSETEWLIDREWTLAVMGSYSCGPCQYRDKDDLLCIFRKCPKFEVNYKDAAEFEARVVAKLAFFEDGCTPCSKPKKCPFDALDIIECVPCRLKYARLAVEEEMS